ncbi:MAG: PLP-dependent aminotransferase family protein [Alphaproteobacteria bacterium]|nr:PLP-dependent aminotransferase family protein [Alphaproteobacteria bacterium]
MRHISFHLDPDSHLTLQGQIRYFLMQAIIKKQLVKNTKLPSTRALAKQLGVSRNTVTLAYQALENDNLLSVSAQSGYYVAEIDELPAPIMPLRNFSESSHQWHDKLNHISADSAIITKPENWRDYPYPFLYGQSDMGLFPFSAWRNCMRQAMTRKLTEKWTDDLLANDDSELIKQIREHILITRGIQVTNEQIIITVGAQNALFLTAHLLTKPSSILAMEDPGYTDVRHLFAWLAKTTDYGATKFFPIKDYADQDGLDANRLSPASLLYVTPSHQVPTGITMSLQRRRDLLQWAEQHDAIIIEDDYDFEINPYTPVLPTLKSIDKNDRVIYIGSFSKSMMPGLRLGYLVGAPDFINEARKLKRLCLRHAPGNNQRALALFLALGDYELHYHKLRRVYEKRSMVMGEALQQYASDLQKNGWHIRPRQGGMSYWLEMPEGNDSRALAQQAMQQGILIEPGGIFFDRHENNHHHIRLGFSSLEEKNITNGIDLFYDIIKKYHL